jgi:hypothetical protein
MTALHGLVAGQVLVRRDIRDIATSTVASKFPHLAHRSRQLSCIRKEHVWRGVPPQRRPVHGDFFHCAWAAGVIFMSHFLSEND